MAAQLRVKRSAVPGRIPDIGSLDLGEIAINTYDGKLYIKKTQNSISTIVDIGSPPVSSLADVDITNLENGSLLIFNQTSTKWVASRDLDEQRLDAGFF
jgi:hypothetical protein